MTIEIPYRELSPEALHGILEEYATRGGFDSELPLSDRIAVLRSKLDSGQARIIYDPEEGTTNLVTALDGAAD